jgi:hypothetical protein
VKKKSSNYKNFNMDTSHFIDWHDEFRQHPDRWLNHGRRVAEDSCTHKTQDNGSETNMRYCGWCEECDFYEDSCEPMMNYGYPLCFLPEDKKILQIVKGTCLTVMENDDTGECFLVLCGGGMDLSQSIAYAYLLAGERIPDELAFEVCTQPCLSVGKKEYLQVMRECKKELIDLRRRALGRIKQITTALKDVSSCQTA